MAECQALREFALRALVQLPIARGVIYCAALLVAPAQHHDSCRVEMSAQWRPMRYFFVGSVSKS
jgi:hypothetical protein